MSEPEHDYRIDYDAPDVLDLMRQVRERAAAGIEPAATGLTAPGEDARSRLREYLEVDRPRELEQSLGFGGSWNVTPEDLRRSHPGGFGALIGGIRRALRPVTKLLANLDLPLYKQHVVNLGLATAIHDLLQENRSLGRRLASLERRLEAEEGGEAGETGAGGRPGERSGGEASEAGVDPGRPADGAEGEAGS